MKTKTIRLTGTQVRRMEDVLVRHRLFGKFGWHTNRVGSSKKGVVVSAGASPRDIITLSLADAVTFAVRLVWGERAWIAACKEVVAARAKDATIETKVSALRAVCAAVGEHRLKNASLHQRLELASSLHQQVALFCEMGLLANAHVVADEGLRLISSLLSRRKYLVLIPDGVARRKSRWGMSSKDKWTVAKIDKAVRTWALYDGFVGESCSECRATANVLGGGDGWLCECGQYNRQAWRGGMMPHTSPDYGPNEATIRKGNHLSCDTSCCYCHPRRPAQSAPTCEAVSA